MTWHKVLRLQGHVGLTVMWGNVVVTLVSINGVVVALLSPHNLLLVLVMMWLCWVTVVTHSLVIGHWWSMVSGQCWSVLQQAVYGTGRRCRVRLSRLTSTSSRRRRRWTDGRRWLTTTDDVLVTTSTNSRRRSSSCLPAVLVRRQLNSTRLMTSTWNTSHHQQQPR